MPEDRAGAGEGSGRSGWFDWTASDLLWERHAEAAARAWRRGDRKEAAVEVERAVALAETRFDRGDPRLAAGYTNRGVLLFASGTPHRASGPFDMAARSWAECWAWLPPVPGAAEGSEEQLARRTAWELVERGTRLTEQASRGEALPTDGLDVWSQRGPTSPHGLRKVMAAFFLMLPGGPRPTS